MKNTTTKDDVIRLLQVYAQTTGMQPTYTMSATELGISPTVVRKMFGTWNAAIVAAGLTLSRVMGVIDVTCSWCGAHFTRVHSQLNSLHNYCSSSCAAKANNTGSRHSEVTKRKLSIALAAVPRPKRPNCPKTSQTSQTDV